MDKILDHLRSLAISSLEIRKKEETEENGPYSIALFAAKKGNFKEIDPSFNMMGLHLLLKQRDFYTEGQCLDISLFFETLEASFLVMEIEKEETLGKWYMIRQIFKPGPVWLKKNDESKSE